MINKNPIEEFDTEEPGMYIQQVGTFSSPTRIHVFPIYLFFARFVHIMAFSMALDWLLMN